MLIIIILLIIIVTKKIVQKIQKKRKKLSFNRRGWIISIREKSQNLRPAKKTFFMNFS
jgi:hypothetical protein